MNAWLNSEKCFSYIRKKKYFNIFALTTTFYLQLNKMPYNTILREKLNDFFIPQQWALMDL